MKNKDCVNNKKKFSSGFLKAGAVAVAIAMALGAGALKLSDADNDEMLEAVNPTYVIEESIDLPPEPVAEALIPERKEREKQGVSIGSILMYIGGWILSALISILGKTAGPVAARILGWIILIAAIIAAVIFALKKAFPDIALKDLIPKRTAVLAVLAIAAIIAVGELVIHFYGSSYSLPVQCFAMVGGLLTVLLVFNACSNAAVKLPLKEG